MHARIELTLEPFVRVVLVSILAGTLSCLSFTFGWIGGQAYRITLPKAIQELEERLGNSLESLKKLPVIGKIIENLTKGEQDWMGFKLFSYELAPKPKDPLKSLEDLAKLRSLKPVSPPSASVAPSVEPVIVPPVSLTDRLKVFLVAALERGEYGRRPEKLLKTDITKLKEDIQRYKEIGPGDVFEILAKVWSLPYVADGLRRDVNLKAFATTEIREMYGLTELQALRLVMGWDIADMQKAFKEAGIKGIADLALGRPAEFFFKLDAESKGVRGCRLHLSKVEAAGAAGTTIPAEVTKRLQSGACPDGGRYEESLDRGFSCTIHGTLQIPQFPHIHYALYLESADESERLLARDEPELAIEKLLEALRIYPNNVIAAYDLALAYYKIKDHDTLASHLSSWEANLGHELRMGFLQTVAQYAGDHKERVRQIGQKALEARFGAPPARLTTLKEYYLHQDRVREVVQSSEDGLLFIDFSFKPEARCDSQKCYASLGDVVNQIEGFLRGYPKNHPLLERIDAAVQKLVRIQKGAGVEKLKLILTKIRGLEAKKRLIFEDTGGKFLWKALTVKIGGGFFEPCPRNGRYLLLAEGRLECSKHRGMFDRKVDFGTWGEPEESEIQNLSTAVLQAALAGDRGRSQCFDLQKEYTQANDLAKIGPSEGLAPVKLASGKSLECPRKGLYSVAEIDGRMMVHCSVHEAFDAYFDLNIADP